jgi:hypothetical protein
MLYTDEPVFKLTQKDLTDLIERCVERVAAGQKSDHRAGQTALDPGKFQRVGKSRNPAPGLVGHLLCPSPLMSGSE